MHTVKASWVGRTFAQAKCNDSGEKKSRVRRSKEERKAMVESFIKKYQSKNNGNFPSLSLTHKEVGGSFYTVREIVREIIQENRVLGPAKLTSEEQGTDQFSKQYPLGSISTEPQLQFDEVHLVSIDHQTIGKESVSTLRGDCTDHGSQSSNNKTYVNRTCIDEKHEEFNEWKPLEQGNGTAQVDDEPVFTEDQVTEKMEIVKNTEVSIAKITPIVADIIVETFPLKSAPKPINSMDGRSQEARDLTGNLEEQETEVEAASGHSYPIFQSIDSEEDNSTGLINANAATSLQDPPKKGIGSSGIGKGISNSLLEGSNLTNVSNYDTPTLHLPDQNREVSRIESVNASTTRSTHGESHSQPVVKKAGIQHSRSTEDGICSTLNRTKLESWKGESKKPAGAETNLIWAVFKAFIDSFVKFWSE
uniref:AT3G52170-like helix-turn-helix domain-containing protein n=1 Tax=Nelumbo nucifera TaxID=4432 RepID=A0A822ZW89_NELNU|nr:TPA_asm: hypothetical protein HUJ06_018687 [Nelumbo nucifera]